jgi:hypothetical protein
MIVPSSEVGNERLTLVSDSSILYGLQYRAQQPAQWGIFPVFKQCGAVDTRYGDRNRT